VQQLNIRVELQTATQKIHLPFKSNLDTVEEFESDQKFDGIVEYDVKELGNHMYNRIIYSNFIFWFVAKLKITISKIQKRLICMVSYLNEKMEKMSFKKFYKFIVSKPFEIQPRYPYVEVKINFIFFSQLR
jgi:hypothetical protein